MQLPEEIRYLVLHEYSGRVKNRSGKWIVHTSLQFPSRKQRRMEEQYEFPDRLIRELKVDQTKTIILEKRFHGTSSFCLETRVRDQLLKRDMVGEGSGNVQYFPYRTQQLWYQYKSPRPWWSRSMSWLFGPSLEEFDVAHVEQHHG